MTETAPTPALNPIREKTPDAAIEACMSDTGLERAVVSGVLGDMARMVIHKNSLAQVASRWGLPFQEALRVQKMGRIAIEDIRHGMATKAAVSANAAMDIFQDKLNDPEQVAELSLKDAAGVAKTATGNAMMWAGEAGGGVTVNVGLAIGDLRMLKQQHEERTKAPTLEDRLRERSIDVESHVG